MAHPYPNYTDVLSKLNNRNGAIICCIGAVASLYAIYYKQCQQTKFSPLVMQKSEDKKYPKDRKKISVDTKFLRNLIAILKVMVPSCFSAEISIVNNLLKYGLSELQLCLRTRLTNYLYEQYLKLRQPLGKMTVTEQELEGEFRYINSRLIANSEEIAFYQGSAREKRTLLQSFQRLISHLRKLVWFRFSIGFLENIVAKYLATVVGFLAVSRPYLAGKKETFLNKSHNRLMEDYYKSGRMLIKLAEAIGRLASAGREMNKLAGFTVRVTELINVLNDLNKGHYTRTMVGQGNGYVPCGVLNSAKDNDAVVPTLTSGCGEIIPHDNLIRFEHVPLITPNGDLLIKELNLEVKSGINVLVCGPNGCGKSSLFRVLGELWPLFGGKLTKPAKGKLFYIPQRPYMTIGTLRDQVLYPDTKEDMANKGFSDHHLEKYLDLVHLTYILKRENGWESVQDWMDVLSGGEKQRIAMARLFYHAPQFAILDECTSAVSVDVEGSMYQYCRNAGITLFTVSHRKSLWQYQDFYLHLAGKGNYEFRPIDENTKEFGS